MIVHNSDLNGSTRCPLKYDSPLVIDTDAVKADQIIFKLFELIVRRGFQIVENFSIGNHVKLSNCNLRDCTPPDISGHSSIQIERFSGFVAK